MKNPCPVLRLEQGLGWSSAASKVNAAIQGNGKSRSARMQEKNAIIFSRSQKAGARKIPARSGKTGQGRMELPCLVSSPASFFTQALPARQ
jgi:hypothetical protein